MNKETHEIFVTALLKSIWPEEMVMPCLGVDVEACWQKHQGVIREAQEAVCPGARVEASRTDMPSPFAYLWETDDEGKPVRRLKPDLTTAVATLPDDLQQGQRFLFPASGDTSAQDLLNQLSAKLTSISGNSISESSNHFRHDEALLSLIRFFASQIVINGHNSLFDYARLTAAASVCSLLNEADEDGMLFIKGDISGIQEFIFDTESKGAAKALKARSLRIQAMAFMAVDYLLKELKVSPANLLYNGGGSFYLIAPRSMEKVLLRCRKEFAFEPLNMRGADISIPEVVQVILAFVPLAKEQFRNGFAERWKALDTALNEHRLQFFDLSQEKDKQSESDLESKSELLFHQIFDPLSPYSFTDRRKLEKAYYRNVTKGPQGKKMDDYASNLHNYKGFGLSLQPEWQLTKKERFYRDEDAEEDLSEKTIPDPYTGFHRRLVWSSNEQACSVLINKSKLMLSSWSNDEKDFVPKPVTYLVKDLPTWKPHLLENSKNKELIAGFQKYNKGLEKSERDDPQEDFIISFGYLAEFAGKRTGTPKLGVLKMDIDNLGNSFRSGIRDENGKSSILHTAALSRAMEWFFEGHINVLLDTKLIDWFTKSYCEENEKLAHYKNLLDSAEESFRDNIYVIFSGGDDCLMVGAWDLILEFGKLIRDEFDRFTGGTLTLSAGVVMVGPKFPVSRFAVLAEEALGVAKASGKNCIQVFGQVLTWDDFDKARELRSNLYYLVTKPEDRESRAILWKVQKSISGYIKVMKDIQNQRSIYLPRLWRLYHYLREVKKGNKEFVENEIVSMYENLFKKNLQPHPEGKSIGSPLLIAVGVRWAEFMSRK